MAFLLRLRALCGDDQHKTEVLAALNEACRINRPYKGITTYHVYRPDPTTRPNYMWTVEVFKDEDLFFEHMTPELGALLGPPLDPSKFDNLFQGDTYHDPANLASDKLVEVLKGFSFPEENHHALAMGYVLRPDAVFTSRKYAVLMVARFITKDTEAVLAKLKPFVEDAHKEVVTLAVVVTPELQKESEGQSEVVDIIEVVSSNAGLVKHVGGLSSRAALAEASELCQNVEFSVYGELLESAKDVLASYCPGLQCFPTEEGWIIHPDVEA